MTTEQDNQIAIWMNMQCASPKQFVQYTKTEYNYHIRRGLKLHGITADETNVSHVRNLLQDRGLAIPTVHGASRVGHGFRTIFNASLTYAAQQQATTSL